MVMGRYLTFAEVAGRETTTPSIMHVLTRLHRPEVLRVLASLSLTLSRRDPHTKQGQWRMAQAVLSPARQRELATVLRRLDRQEGMNWAVFHRRSIFLTLQFALLACRDDAPRANPATVVHAVGDCCLMANDILFALESDEGPDEGDEAFNRWVAHSLLPIIDREAFTDVLARAQSFWFDLPADKSVAKAIERQAGESFQAAFARHFGIELRQFFMVVLSLYAHFGEGVVTDAPARLLSPETYLVPFFGRELVGRVLPLITTRPDQMACRLLQPRQGWAADLTPFRQYPLLEVFPGQYACPDFDTLHRALVDRIYFMLDEALGREKFRQAFGHVFEAYINRLIGQFALDRESPLVRNYYPAPSFQGTNDEAGDGLLTDESLAVTFEVKARPLTTREKFAGSVEVLWAGICDIVGRQGRREKKGTAQLADNVARMLKGHPVRAGKSVTDVSKCRKVIPALIVYEEGVSLGAIRRFGDRQFRGFLATKGVDTDRVGPLLILSIHDMELLEKASRVESWAAIFEGYAGWVASHPDDPVGNFHTYIARRGLIDRVRAGESLTDRLYAQALERAQAELPTLRLPLPQDEGAGPCAPPGAVPKAEPASL
jgi:hypothetical protein